ncbi:MAG: hypothetical protein H6746_15640 [Deltaproteobacteria bacterium]|nr:hypothetical protein [Deltaproteobacteria bacterium]
MTWTVRLGRCLARIHGAGRLPDDAWAQLIEGYTPPGDPWAGTLAVEVGPPLADAPTLPDVIDLVPAGEGACVHEGPVWSLRLCGLGGGGSPAAQVRFRRAIAERGAQAEALVMLVRALAATVAVLDDAVLVHGAALVPRGSTGALICLGPSGHGKSTMLRRLPGAAVLADDTVLLRRPAGGGPWLAYGTPLAGKERHPRTGGPVVVERLVTLVPGAERLELARLEPAAAFRELVARTFWFVRDGELPQRLMTLLHALATEHGVQRLSSSLHHDVRPLLGAPLAEVPCSPA